MLHIDFETRSRADLPAVGPWVYANDPSTEIICMAYSFGNDVELWIPGQPFPAEVFGHVNMGGTLVAHNAAFERRLWNLLPCPNPDLNQWRCTQAAAARRGLPQQLERLASALEIEINKDLRGKRLIKQLSIPQEDGTFNTDPALLQEMYEYCIQDVRVEMAICDKIPLLEPGEQRVWELDQTINDRGIAIDRDLARAIKTQTELHLSRLEQEFVAITGECKPTEVAKFKKWLLEQTGVEHRSLAAERVRELIESETTPDNVRRALRIRELSASNSVKKVDQFLARSESGRMRDHLKYHAAQPGRWAGSGAQIQNLPRGSISDMDFLAGAILADSVEMFFSQSTTEVMRSALRGILIPTDGNDLLVWDYGQIEARLLAWAAGETELLQQFSEGADPYVAFAQKIWPGETITKDQRLVGKVCILGLGYGMGWVKFGHTLKGFGVQVSDGFAKRCVAVYRHAYPKIPRFWRLLENKMRDACQGRPNNAYMRDGEFVRARMPSGRDIFYYKCFFDTRAGSIRYQKLYGAQMIWIDTYGGKLTENLIQGLARDVLVSGMMRLRDAGFYIVGTVHDEIIADDDGDRLDEGSKLLTIAPVWATGLPLAVDGFSCERYRK